MSTLGTSTLALALVYVCIGGHALLVWGGRRNDQVVGAFGIVCLSMALFALGSTALNEATTLSAAAFAQDLELFASSIAVAAYIVFSDELRGHHNRWVRGFGLATPVVAGVLWLFGFLHEPVPLHGPELLQARLTPAGNLLEAWLVVGTGVAAYLAYSGEDRQQLRPAPIAPILVVGAVIFDLWSEHHRLDIVYVTEYAFLALALSGSERLMARGRRVARALQQRKRELQQNAQTLKETQQETVRREQLAAVGKLSAIVAHELRNPLSIIGNACSSLARGQVADWTWSELLDVIDDEADRLDRLVGDVLTYTRPVELRPVQVAAGELLSMMARRWQRSDPPGAPVRVEIENPSDDLCCYADAELLCQALHNVIDNAYRAMPGGGTVRAAAHLDQLDGMPATVLRVSDDGPGMPAEVLSRARELFFTTREDGTGLGLAVVERVVRAHRGRLEIESAPGRGTVISLCIPQYPRDAKPLASAGAAQ